MIKVCDAIMGSGKSSAAITYINEHPEKRFLYITPYTTETERVEECCRDAKFVLPVVHANDDAVSKTDHTYQLLKEGRNVASTHMCLMRYTDEMLQILRDNKYTVIIDEAISVLTKINMKGNYDLLDGVSSEDVEIMLSAGLIYQSGDNEYRRTDKEVNNCKYKRILKTMSNKPLANIGNDDSGWNWIFSADIFRYAEDVIVLTYLFKGSEMEQFLMINGLDYSNIWISHPSDNLYRFSEKPDYVPEYVYDLKNKVHIYNRRIMNSIGDKKFSLSINWFAKRDKDHKDILALKKYEANFFNNFAKDSSSETRMCATAGNNWKLIKCNGCGKKELNGVAFNMRSKNKWSDRIALSYPVNIFFNPVVARYYKERGGCIDENNYALSIMIQWIWRSAIRNGKDIYVYVPSKRMRTLLTNWVNSFGNGGETNEA